MYAIISEVSSDTGSAPFTSNVTQYTGLGTVVVGAGGQTGQGATTVCVAGSGHAKGGGGGQSQASRMQVHGAHLVAVEQ